MYRTPNSSKESPVRACKTKERSHTGKGEILTGLCLPKALKNLAIQGSIASGFSRKTLRTDICPFKVPRANPLLLSAEIPTLLQNSVH